MQEEDFQPAHAQLINQSPRDPLRLNIIQTLKNIFDPEIPVNIFELGLIYNVDIDDTNTVTITMTLTSPNCPVAESLPNEVVEKIKTVEGVSDCKMNLTFEPTWAPDKMTEAARLELNMF